MGTSWIRMSPKEVGFIEDTIHAASASLPDLGLHANLNRFPFAMHHGYYRTRLRLHGRRLRHEEVAILLNRWAQTKENPIEVYVWQAIAGAVLKLKTKKEFTLPSFIREGVERVSQGDEFEAWAKSTLESAGPEELNLVELHRKRL